MTTMQEKADALFKNSEILAPMVRASTTPLRMLALSYGADLVYTEEIIDRAITSTDRIISNINLKDVEGNDVETQTIDYVKRMSSFSPKVQRRMKANNETQPIVLRIVPSKEKGKLIYQMGTGESNLALQAATLVEKDVDGIDINMGCPKKFSVSGGMGSALLKDIERASDIIKTLKRNIHTVPISCKIRLLENEAKTMDFIKGLVHAGINAITIHGRMVGDESTQVAKLDRLVQTVQLIKSSSGTMNHIPIIINGDLYTRNDMINMRRKSGADGVMLARPALYNTSIFIKPPDHHCEYNNDNNTNHDDDDDDEIKEETRYGYDSPLLKSKTSVIQEYLTNATLYKAHHKNVKYVICEMMNNRRTPSILTPFMTHSYPGKQSIDLVCKCKSPTLDDLCLLWNVKTSTGGNSSNGIDNTINMTNKATITMTTRKNDNHNHNQHEKAASLHRYDDRYFLDPNALRKEQQEKIKNNQAREEAADEKNDHHRHQSKIRKSVILSEEKEKDMGINSTSIGNSSSSVSNGDNNDGNHDNDHNDVKRGIEVNKRARLKE